MFCYYYNDKGCSEAPLVIITTTMNIVYHTILYYNIT